MTEINQPGAVYLPRAAVVAGTSDEPWRQEAKNRFARIRLRAKLEGPVSEPGRGVIIGR